MFHILMIEKDMRGGKSHAIHRYTTANNKYMRKHKKTKNLHILQSVWIGNISKITCWQFWMDKNHIKVWWKVYDENSNKGHILKVGVEYPNVPHRRTLKQALSHRLILKKMHRVIKFN